MGGVKKEVRDKVLSQLSDGDEELASLLAWPADSAGGIMSPSFFSMPDSATCGVAIRALQRMGDQVDSVHYVYVVDVEQRLVGVVSLRQLVIRPPTTPLTAIMVRDPIAVSPQDDQEEVARFVARYDLLAIPVVDEHRKILGIVTVDDVVDVIREEAAEDMYKMAGMAEADPRSGTTLRQTQLRAGWLFATLGGGLLAAELIGIYEESLQKVAALASFIPVIMGMAGNVGIQSATVAVRGLATGHIQVGGAATFILRELRVGALLGVIYGVFLSIYGFVRFSDLPLIGVAVGSAIIAAIGGAAVMGAAIPVVLSRFRIDPAVATGPLVTTIVDIVAIALYFNIAKVLLGI